MKIQVQIYLPDQNQGTVWGYGTIYDQRAGRDLSMCKRQVQRG